MALEYKMKQGKDNTVVSREHTGHSKHSFPTTQETTLHMDEDISQDGQYEIRLIMFFVAKDGEALYSQ